VARDCFQALETLVALILLDVEKLVCLLNYLLRYICSHLTLFPDNGRNYGIMFLKFVIF